MHLASRAPRWLTPETLVVVSFVAATGCLAQAISQTQGVRYCELLIDGKREDVALAPRKISVLRELVLIDAATGKRF